MAAIASHLRRIARCRQILFLPLFALVLFAPAGSLHIWQAWLFAFVFIASTSALALYFMKNDPALIERRRAVGPAAETEPAQKVIMTMISAGFLLLIVVPGLDHRWHWSDAPTWLVLSADIGVVLSNVVFFVVMKQNSYAAATIRVEAGQPVVSTGAYAVVRHPMYAGALLLLVCTPLALGSYWTLLVLILLVPLLAWRLLDEERFLKVNLPGYADYCRHVRYRLIPFLW
ncbi:MAG: methyltransferase family protein [Pseudolabrys sp.]